MFAILKFIYILCRSIYRGFRNGLNPNLNSLRHAHPYLKYYLSIQLSAFWSLAFGLYIGELMTIGYSILGHWAIITMVFVTVSVLRTVRNTYAPREGTVDYLRAPDRGSRCDELTDEQRAEAIGRLNKDTKHS